MVEVNETNFRLVLDKIKAHPQCWKQDSWHCGTQHCFAGWAQILSGKEANDQTVRRDARVWLGLSKVQADYLFAAASRMADFESFIEKDDRAGYDRAGYNRDGYNRAGYDCDGYNRDGYNRAGYDCDGYDSDGYDCDGLDAENNPRPDPTEAA